MTGFIWTPDMERKKKTQGHFVCDDCGKDFAKLIPNMLGESVKCPECGSANVRKDGHLLNSLGSVVCW
jgi:putative FmdB family regulatory protein